MVPMNLGLQDMSGIVTTWKLLGEDPFMQIIIFGWDADKR